MHGRCQRANNKTIINRRVTIKLIQDLYLELTKRFSYCCLELIVEDFAGCHNCLGIVHNNSEKRRFLYYLLANIFHLNVSFIIVSLEFEH